MADRYLLVLASLLLLPLLLSSPGSALKCYGCPNGTKTGERKGVECSFSHLCHDYCYISYRLDELGKISDVSQGCNRSLETDYKEVNGTKCSPDGDKFECNTNCDTNDCNSLPRIPDINNYKILCSVCEDCPQENISTPTICPSKALLHVDQQVNGLLITTPTCYTGVTRNHLGKPLTASRGCLTGYISGDKSGICKRNYEARQYTCTVYCNDDGCNTTPVISTGRQTSAGSSCGSDTTLTMVASVFTVFSLYGRTLH